MLSAPAPADIKAFHGNFYSFINRLKRNKEALAISGVPKELIPFIKQENLDEIYQNLIEIQETVQSELQKSQHCAVHIGKASGNPRTVNIVRDIDGTIMLMLETKSTLANGEKNPETPVWEGGEKKGKPCWRIDSEQPEEWVNMVLRNEDPIELANISEEALLSQKLAKIAKEQGLIPNPFNYSLLGAMFQKEGIWKQSFYSPRATCSLGKLFKDIAADIAELSKAEKDSIMLTILHAFKIMHNHNIIFQDLKDENVLLYLKNGKYYAKLTDFGFCVDEEQVDADSSVDGTLLYESPEVSLAFEDPELTPKGAEAFHDDSYPTLGRAVSIDLSKRNPGRTPSSALGLEYRKPHKKNDVWSMGILFYDLIYGERPITADKATKLKIAANPLLQGLLTDLREDRFSSDEAFECFSKLLTAAPRRDKAKKASKRKPSIRQSSRISSRQSSRIKCRKKEVGSTPSEAIHIDISDDEVVASPIGKPSLRQSSRLSSRQSSRIKRLSPREAIQFDEIADDEAVASLVAFEASLAPMSVVRGDAPLAPISEAPQPAARFPEGVIPELPDVAMLLSRPIIPQFKYASALAASAIASSAAAASAKVPEWLKWAKDYLSRRRNGV